MEAVKDCDAALFVVDDSKPLTDEDRRAMDAALEAPEAIAILNKQDLAAVIEPSDLPFSYIKPDKVPPECDGLLDGVARRAGDVGDDDAVKAGQA